jgi:hypothetical protein
MGEVGSFATFVFKIRICDHPCNPRGKPYQQMLWPQKNKEHENFSFDLAAVH